MSKKVTLTLPSSNYKFDEAIKTLRTNLIFCGSSVRTVMFTSTKPNEGKTEVAFSVAASMAQMGKKVLFVDTDIRKSVLLNRYHLSVAVKGLSEYLSGQIPMEDVVCETNVENLHVIFAGSTAPNSAELLEEASFGTLLKEARAEYDYIIIDTPAGGNGHRRSGGRKAVRWGGNRDRERSGKLPGVTEGKGTDGAERLPDLRGGAQQSQREQGQLL